MLLLYKATVAFLLAFVTTTYAELPQRVIEAKDALFHDLQSLHDIISGQHHHVDEYQLSVELHDLLNEFLTQNQQSIGAILRVLQLIDHDLENVIHDCVRVFDLDSLQSTNPIFEQVTKPLLLQVRDLCELISDGGRIDEVESSLERVEQEASVYRESMEQALKDIAVIFGQLEEDHYGIWIHRKSVQMEAQILSLNTTLAADLFDTFNKHGLEWGRKRDKLVIELLSNYSYDDLDKIPPLASLYKTWDTLDNETTVLQSELEEFLNDWMLTLVDTVEFVANNMDDNVDDVLEYPLEAFTKGVVSLRCVAAYYEAMDKAMMSFMPKYFQCIDYEEDMRNAFTQIAPVLDSADKAISFLMDSYNSCAKMAPEVDLSDCMAGLQEYINKTQEFVEQKAIEVYNHVEDAMIFNEVIMGACMNKEVREMSLQIGGTLNAFEDCKL